MRSLANWYLTRKTWQRMIIFPLSWPVGVVVLAMWLLYVIMVMPVAAVETILEDSR